MLHNNRCLRIISVDALSVMFSPGPMMVYALTLNTTTVLGGRSLSVCCVADVLNYSPVL